MHFRAKAGAAVQIAFMQGENGGRYSHAMASVTYLGEHPHDRGGSNATLSGRLDGAQVREAAVPVHILVIERLNGRLQHDGWHRLDVSWWRPGAASLGRVSTSSPSAGLRSTIHRQRCHRRRRHRAALAADRADIVRGRALCGAKCTREVWCSSVDDANGAPNAYVLRKRTNLYSRCFFEGGKCHLSLGPGHCTQNGNSWVKH